MSFTLFLFIYLLTFIINTKLDRLAAEHGSGEVKRQTDPCLQTKKKNGKRKRKEEASAQNRSGNYFVYLYSIDIEGGMIWCFFYDLPR